MGKPMKEILREQLQTIKPSREELKEIAAQTKQITEQILKNLKKSKTSADVFVGGSSAKNTIIRKKKYDIDIFVRFDKKYKEEKFSAMLKNLLPQNATRKKGSRDYFSIRKNDMEFEIVPTARISKPEEAKNITDLSYFHVNYIKKKLKANLHLADEIRLAKAFAYYQECYGAESYINGFSGYAIELLVIHYKNFINFIKETAKMRLGKKEAKLVIDDGKFYKSREDVFMHMNESKFNQSPIILVDPTFRQRNALAALSYKTLIKFQKACRAFLKKPLGGFFEEENKEENLVGKYGNKLIKLKITTKKQAGDIAGTKLKKFYGYFVLELEKLFDVEKSDFEYDEPRNFGVIFLVAEPKKQIVFSGPPIIMKEALQKFKKEHKRIKIKKGRAYAVEKLNIDFEKFLKCFRKSKKCVLKEMGIKL